MYEGHLAGERLDTNPENASPVRANPFLHTPPPFLSPVLLSLRCFVVVVVMLGFGFVFPD